MGFSGLARTRHVHRIGRQDVEPLAHLALSGRPPKAIVGRRVELMSGWADQEWAQGTIEKQITSIILRRGSVTPECGYHNADRRVRGVG